MQQLSLCPGCARPVSTRYPFMHRAGYSVRAFCVASCFVKWDREQQWRQHQIAMNAADDRPPLAPAPSDARHLPAANASRGSSAAPSFDVVV